MNRPKVSLDIHLSFLYYHLQFQSSYSPVFCPLILITFQLGPNGRFSSHNPKTSHNILILDISHTAGRVCKTQQVCSKLAALDKPYSLVIKQFFRVSWRLLLFLWYQYNTDIIACHQQQPANLFTPFCHIK